MRRMILAGIALAGLASLTACGFPQAGSGRTSAFAGSCTRLLGHHANGLDLAMVNITNQSGVPLTLSAFTVEAWNNGARVGDVVTRFHHPRHVRPGRTQTIYVYIDGRAQKCDVTQFTA